MDILFMSIFGKRKIVLGKWIFGVFGVLGFDLFNFLDSRIPGIQDCTNSKKTWFGKV